MSVDVKGIAEKERVCAQVAAVLGPSNREAVRFTTPSGVRAIVATTISREALDKLARKLERKLASSTRSRT